MFDREPKDRVGHASQLAAKQNISLMDTEDHKMIDTEVNSPSFQQQTDANNSNTVKVESFQNIRLQVGKSFKFNNVDLTFSGGINNIFNERYFDNIRLNAFGKRYYEPAPTRNAYLGFQIEI